MEREFERRKFSAGLLIALIDLVREIREYPSPPSSLDELFERFPRKLETTAGKRANTLILTAPDRNISLRPFYNEIERFFRSEMKRFDYPACAPHATQAWPDYRSWIDELLRLSDDDLLRLRELVRDFVLDRLPSQAFVPSSVSSEPPLLR